jgi:hypothetical protein
MKKILVVLTTVVLSVLLMGIPAWALIDPSTLFIGDGTSVPTGSDPNPINSTSFNIYQNPSPQAPNELVNDPLTLLFLVPLFGTSANTSLFNAGSISSATLLGENLNVTVGSSFGTMTTASAFQTTLTGLEKHPDLYSVIGLGSLANNSFNWTNLTTSPFPGGITNPDVGATGFAIYAFSLTDPDEGTNVDGKQMVDILMSGSGLPIGTFVAAFGENDQFAFSTPFTQAGINVPEPDILLLFGSALLGIGFFSRKKFVK